MRKRCLRRRPLPWNLKSSCLESRLGRAGLPGYSRAWWKAVAEVLGIGQVWRYLLTSFLGLQRWCHFFFQKDSSCDTAYLFQQLQQVEGLDNSCPLWCLKTSYAAGLRSHRESWSSAVPEKRHLMLLTKWLRILLSLLGEKVAVVSWTAEKTSNKTPET